MLTVIDFLIILAYMLLMLYIGYRSSKKINTVKDFVVAGGTFSFGVVLATMVATGMGAGNLFGRSGYAYNAGAAMTVAMVGYIAAMITASFFSKKLEKYKVISMPELFCKFWGITGTGKAARIAAALITFIYNIGILGLQFVAFGTLISLLGSTIGITPKMGMLIGAIITIAYTGVGGMFSVAYTDVAQFVLMVAGVIIIGPIVAITAAGGYAPVLESATAAGISVWNPFTGRSGQEILGLFLVGWMLNSVDPFVWQRIFSAKSFKIARRAIIVNGFVCFLFCFALTQMALAGRVLLPDLVLTHGTTEAVLPTLIMTVFPTGIIGIMITACIATLMSSADSYLLQASNALVYDFIAFIKPELSEKTKIKYLKYSVFLIGAFGLFMALFMKSLFSALIFCFSVYSAAIFVPVVLGLYWKRSTAAGALCAMLVGASIVIYGYFGGWYPLGWDPVVPATVASFIVMVTVSLLTRKQGTVMLPSESEAA